MKGDERSSVEAGVGTNVYDVKGVLCKQLHSDDAVWYFLRAGHVVQVEQQHTDGRDSTRHRIFVLGQTLTGRVHGVNLGEQGHVGGCAEGEVASFPWRFISRIESTLIDDQLLKIKGSAVDPAEVVVGCRVEVRSVSNGAQLMEVRRVNATDGTLEC